MQVIDLNSKFNLFKDFWSPKIVAELNDHQFKIAKIKGEFVFHKHDHTDEAFIVITVSYTHLRAHETLR